MAKFGFFKSKNLWLPRLSAALRCVQEDPTSSQKALAGCMGVNQPVGASFSNWLRHTGLVKVEKKKGSSSLTYHLTPVGALIAEHDPQMADLGTQWLLHYYLATEHEQRSDAWYTLFNDFLSPSMSFTRKEYQSYFADLKKKEPNNYNGFESDAQAALYTYYNREKSLGALELLTKEKKGYTVGNPRYPDILVVGFMLFDWWKRHYDDTNTLRFSQLCQAEGSLGRLCVATPSQIRRFVLELTGLGYLSFSDTQHEPVNRLYNDEPQRLLERYYE